MTTTTAKAAQVVRQLEFLLQVVWSDLDVHLVQVTEDWAQVALAGPHSREVLARITDLDVSNEALPFMAARACTLAGVPARVFRISFSGELAYELAVPADYGPHLWQSLLAAGGSFEITPYGTEAMNILDRSNVGVSGRGGGVGVVHDDDYAPFVTMKLRRYCPFARAVVDGWFYPFASPTRFFS
jgi:sarcosine oxidase subunit alpha